MKNVILILSLFAMSMVDASNIKIICTSALLSSKFEERKQEYIKSLKILEQFGYRPQTYIVEAEGYSPFSFYHDYCDHVFYANTNDLTLINKGVNEAKSLIEAFDYYDFDDEDMLVKLTGRYFFNDDHFLKLVEAHSDVDAFASVLEWDPSKVTTGCFAMRAKYFKQMLKRLDLQKMEKELIDIEWEAARFLEQMASENANVVYLEKIGITANVANTVIVQW